MGTTRKLARFLRPYWRWVILAPVTMLLEVAVDLMQPRLIQSIVETGRVPAQWKKPFPRRLSQARGNTAREAAIRQQAQAAYIQKLDVLIHYLEHSKLVDSEETRQVVLERLAQVRETWSKGQEVY